jgi:hypothetical protein
LENFSLLFSSPLMGEDKGEGEKKSNPSPCPLPQRGEGKRIISIDTLAL